MSRLTILPATFAALLMLAGCNGTTQTTPSGKTIATPAPASAITGTDAQRAADEKLWRDVEEKKRKSKSAYISKKNGAYQNYVP